MKIHQLKIDTRGNQTRLLPFGQEVYTKVLEHKKKLENRSKKGVFIDYTNNGYRIYNPEEKTIYVSRDIVPVQLQKERQISAETITIENMEEENNPAEQVYKKTLNNKKVKMRKLKMITKKKKILMKKKEIQVKRRNKRNRKKPKWHDDYVMDTTDEDEALLTYQDCMNSKEKSKWEEVIQEEKNCLDKINTWRLVPEKYAQG